MPGFVHTYPSGVPVGGSGALVEALIRCLKANGAELRNELSAQLEKLLGREPEAAAENSQPQEEQPS